MGAPMYANERGQKSHGPAIEDAGTAAGTAPTDVEFDDLVTKFNQLLAAARSANVIS